MDLIILIATLCLIGFVVYLLTTQIPMPAPWATAIQALAFVVLLLYVLTRVVGIPNVLR